ncbi:TonB-dependent receptor domain-containing protein [Robertkochia aurantiaca]|uniref:TonB-dependent receptor domain-containing protein n=1 Tax=Robertkochia aurantiaca TaxID=2873700 RepID=UPI001CCFA26A|nr:TonB-dependent receptor [Robertkochia sp. 3YJGBD-33]
METLMKTALLILLLLLAQLGLAQSNELNGLVVDDQQQSIPFANISVLQASDSTMVTGGTTDMDGKFRIPLKTEGKFILQCSTIGFSTAYSQAFILDQHSGPKDFGVIALKPESYQLDEVTLTGSRPNVVMKADKMVVRVEGTAMAAGTSALEVVAKSPGVWIDQEGNFQINGRKGAEVMIDGRLTYLSAQELTTLLEGMPAENIEDIEIIANPSAKYDAEGTAGILNINLKENTLSGFNGSAYAGYQYNGINVYNTGVTLNHKKGKWNSFLSADMAGRNRYRTNETFRSFNENGETAIINQDGREDRKRFVPSIRIGTDYSVNDKHTIGVMANILYQNGHTDWNSDLTLDDFDGSTTQIEARNRMDDEFDNSTVNLHYEGKLDTLGTTLSSEFDYVRLNKQVDSRFTNTYTFPDNSTDQEIFVSDNASAYDILAGRADLSLPLRKGGLIETGVKFSRVESGSDLYFFERIGDNNVIDPERSNEFLYVEDIFAAYASYSMRFNETWNLKAGLRAEKTKAQGTSLTLEQVTDRDYLNLFPSLFLQQNVSENYSITYNYSRRIIRPDYDRLNPFIFYIDPFTYIEGDPNLRPQYSHSFQLTQTLFKKYNIILGAEKATDYILEVPVQMEESKQTAYAVRNMDNFYNYSATLVFPVKVTSFWSMNNNVVAAQQEYNTQTENGYLENKQFFFMAQSNNVMNLPGNTRFEVNAAYQGPMAYGVYEVGSQWWIDAGIKKSFMNDKLDLSLSVTDIFRTAVLDVTTTINNNVAAMSQYFGNRSLRVNLRYNFSKGKDFKSSERKSDLEELKRAGGK